MRVMFALILFFLVSTGEALSEECRSKVASFLDHPISKTYQELDSVGNSEKCWSILKDANNLYRLYEHSSKGNHWAIKVLISHLSGLDGGELEDAYIALGESVDVAPMELLIVFGNHQISNDQFKQALLMLPSILVDNKKGSLARLANRKKLIQSINDSNLQNQKTIATEIISCEIKELKRIWP